MKAKLFLCFLLSYSFMILSIGSPVQSPPCQTIRVCDDFKLQIAKEDELFSGNTKTELVPRVYTIGVSFQPNLGPLEGNVKVEADIVERTNRISISVAEHLQIDYRLITIDIFRCPEEQSIENTFGCIEKATYFRDQRVTHIELKGTYLEIGSSVAIAIPRFRNPKYKGSLMDSEGLSVSGYEPEGMRNVFPCLDYFATEAEFRLCQETNPDVSLVFTLSAYDGQSTEATDDGVINSYRVEENGSIISTGLIGALLEGGQPMWNGAYDILTSLNTYSAVKGNEEEEAQDSQPIAQLDIQQIDEL